MYYILDRVESDGLASIRLTDKECYEKWLSSFPECRVGNYFKVLRTDFADGSSVRTYFNGTPDAKAFFVTEVSSGLFSGQSTHTDSLETAQQNHIMWALATETFREGQFLYVRDEDRNPVATLFVAPNGWGVSICNKVDNFKKVEGTRLAVESAVRGNGPEVLSRLQYRKVDGVLLRNMITAELPRLALKHRNRDLLLYAVGQCFDSETLGARKLC